MSATNSGRVDNLDELQRLTARLIPHLDWRCNGLGVLQGYVNEGGIEETRIHIWHPDLEKEGIQDSGKLHDHRFKLWSTILFGTLHHEEYSLFPAVRGAYQAFPVVHAREALKARKTFDGTVTAEAQRYDARQRAYTFQAGDRYTFARRAFHGTYVPGLCVTLVSKTLQEDSPARILAPYGSKPVHAFADPLPREKWAPYLDLAVEALTK